MAKTTENKERNRELVQKRLKDQNKWSWRKLGEHYGIHYTTAKDIFVRTKDKYKV